MLMRKNFRGPTMSNFTFDGVQFFSTWSDCGELTVQQVHDHLQSIRPLKWCRIGYEHHQNGEPHIHACGVWTRRVKTTNCRLLDVNGIHPKWEPMRSIPSSLVYCSKECEFTDFGAVPNTGTSTKFDCLAAAATLDEAEYFSECLKHKVPFQYADKFLKLQKGKKGVTITDDYEPDVTRETLELLCFPFIPDKANIIIGPTGHGKTQWAKRVAPKPCLWVRHIDLLSSFRSGFHKSIIFDEMVFTHYPRETQIQIADWQDQAHIHCRYTVAIIPAGVQRLFCANRDVFDFTDAAIARRCSVRYLLGPGHGNEI